MNGNGWKYALGVAVSLLLLVAGAQIKEAQQGGRISELTERANANALRIEAVERDSQRIYRELRDLNAKLDRLIERGVQGP